MYHTKKTPLITKTYFFERILMKPIGSSVRQVGIEFRKRNLENERRFGICEFPNKNYFIRLVSL